MHRYSASSCFLVRSYVDKGKASGALSLNRYAVYVDHHWRNDFFDLLALFKPPSTLISNTSTTSTTSIRSTFASTTSNLTTPPASSLPTSHNDSIATGAGVPLGVIALDVLALFFLRYHRLDQMHFTPMYTLIHLPH